MEIKKIGVVGAGTMGLGIAQVAAEAGFAVVLNDIKLELVDKALARITKLMTKNVEKGKISSEVKEQVLARIQKSDKIENLADCDLVIEAIVENMEIKKSFYQKLDSICKPEAIFASNTSSLSVSQLANATTRPRQFAGMHFFNPVQMMKLIEVVVPLQASSETIATVIEAGQKMGKEALPVKDSPGFVVNRILTMGGNEVPFMLHEGVATPDIIDKCMKLGANWRMGPCELNDMVGIDISIAVRETLFTEFKDPKYRPSIFQYQMIRAGFLGRKTGKGWYEYDENGKMIGINRDVFK
jgi:3-hydroxyacyl-CoA dehydrogenase (EC 1.1.1.35)